MNGETMIYDVNKVNNYMTKEILKDVEKALSDKGYNANNQIVGYLLTGDLSYISSYKDSRKKIASIDRNKIIEAMLVSYLKEQ